MNKKNYAVLLVGISIYTFVSVGLESKPIEEIETINGVGYDLNVGSGNQQEYILPISISKFKANGEINNIVISERGSNIGEVIQNRQQRLSKKFVQGQEGVVLIGEEYARAGIKSILEDRIRNPEANSRAFVAVCNGKAEDFLKINEKGYSSASDYIKGLIEAARSINFYSGNFKLTDAYVRVGAEGRSLVLPFIDIKNGEIEMTGLAYFNEDKMVMKIGYQDSRILSFLKYDYVRGVASIEKSSYEYIDFEANTGKRKVECYRDGNKYGFIINIKVKGNVVSNELYSKLIKSVKEREKFEEDMKNYIEKECYGFLDKMQNEYKMDCIGLGREAASKYGRRKDIDWNEAISNAKIDVNVKVTVDSQGRGDY